MSTSSQTSPTRMAAYTRPWRLDDLMHEWDFLRRQGFSLDQAAARLNVKRATLDKALCRAKLAGDSRAVRQVAA